MKKAILILSLFLLWKSGISQIYLPSTQTQYGSHFNRLKADYVLHVPTSTTEALNTTDTSAQIRVINGELKYLYGGVWHNAGGVSTIPDLQAVLDAGNLADKNISLLNSNGSSIIFDIESGVSGYSTALNAGSLNLRGTSSTVGLDFSTISNPSIVFTQADGNTVTLSTQHSTGFGQLLLPYTSTQKTMVASISNGVTTYDADDNGNVDISALIPGIAGLPSVLAVDSTANKAINFVKNGVLATVNGTKLIYIDTTKNILFFGRNTGINNTSGTFNIGFGDSVLKYNTSGGSNTAFGFYVLKNNTTGLGNTGYAYSLVNNTTGSYNTAIGNSALFSNISGISNTSIGVSSLYSNTTGNDNTAGGRGSLGLNTTGNANTAYGRNSMSNHISGYGNTVVGKSALTINSSGYHNTIMGDSAAYGNLGFGNTIIGAFSYYNGSGYTGDNNVVIGYNKQLPTLSGSNQTNFNDLLWSRDGTKLGVFNNNPSYEFDVTGRGRFSDTLTITTMGTSDSSNRAASTKLVHQIAASITAGIPTSGWSLTGNSGLTAGTNFIGNTDNVNLVFKVNNLFSGIIGNSTDQNTAFGYKSYSTATSGNWNSFYGYEAGLTTNGSGAQYNTGVGHTSLRSNTSGQANSAVGDRSMYSNTTGIQNTAVGFTALYSNTTGQKNTAVGGQAAFGTTGDFNSVVGNASAPSLTSGTYNSSLGYGSLKGITTGSYNISLGYEAGNGNRSNTLYISDNTYNMHMLLDSAVGSAPSVIGKDALGFWHVYATPSGGGSPTGAAGGGLGGTYPNPTVNIEQTLNGLTGLIKGVAGTYSAITDNSSNWNTAYSWGNHASAGYVTASSTNTFTNKSGNISQWTNDAGYLTSFSETDPVVKAITGIVKSNGTTISAATAGTDYVTPQTTLAGYGITDAYPLSGNPSGFLTALPTLADGKFWVGNGSNVATAVTPSGDVTWTNAGVTSIGAGKVTNAMLVNSATTINGTSISLGSSGTVTAAAGTLTGATLNSTVTASSLTSVGTLAGLSVSADIIPTGTTGTLNLGGASANFAVIRARSMVSNGANMSLNATGAFGVSIITNSGTRMAISSAGVITWGDGGDFAFGTTTGTKIANTTSQKIAFYGSTPIVQPTGNALTALSNLGLVATPTLAESDVTNLTTDLAAKTNIKSIFSGNQNGGTLTSGQTQYILLSGRGALASLANSNIIIGESGTLSNLYVSTAGTQDASGSVVLTLMKNAVATSITITIAAGSSATTYSDLSNTVSVTAGDVIALRAVNNATATSLAFGSTSITLK